ncbi:MAG TPA: hypothetical protein PLN32_07295 [Methanoregulaceae archaeon]|nr:hypothetical protein [Methanoregulaceae archaeon]
MITCFPQGALAREQFQGSAWSKEARFGLRLPGSADRDPSVPGTGVRAS